MHPPKSVGNIKLRLSNTRVEGIVGLFYAAEDSQLTMVKNNDDTLRLKAENIEKLFIHRRGIVAPVAVATGIVTATFAIDNPNALETAIIVVVGIPIGFCVGLVAGEILPIKSFTKNSASMIFR